MAPPANEPFSADVARQAIAYALRAPSSHNSQPWRFHVDAAGIELRGDASRWLRVVDPERRELTLSCGAVLLHVEVALQHAGHAVRVDVLPEPKEPDLFARITRLSGVPTKDEAPSLFDAIAQRRSHRGPFRGESLPEHLDDRLRAACATEGAVLTTIDNAHFRARVGDLVDEGNRTQAGDTQFRRELASWLRPNSSTRPDGMPGHTLGLGELLSRAAPFVVRTFNWGPQRAKVDRGFVRDAPLLAVLHTAEDNPRAWIAAGRGLARLLLTATAEGVSAGFLNQPVQCPPLRERLRALLGFDGFAQAVLRLGIASPTRPTPRRSVSDVVD